MLKKKWIIVIIIALIAVASAVYLITYNNYDSESRKNQTEISAKLYCNTDIDCVPANCCHPNSCINKDFAPSCSGIICSQVCQPGSLDCNQGSCLCVNNKCKAVIE